MAVKVRALAEADIPSVERIEKSITKSARTSSLGRNVREQLKKGNAEACFAAEVDGKFAGFVIEPVKKITPPPD